MSHNTQPIRFSGTFGPEFSEILSSLVDNLCAEMMFTLPSAYPPSYKEVGTWLKTKGFKKKQRQGDWFLRLEPPVEDDRWYVMISLNKGDWYDRVNHLYIQHHKDDSWYVSFEMLPGAMEGRPHVAGAMAKFVTLVMAYRFQLVAV